MKVKTVKGYHCPGCEEFIPKEDLPAISEQFQCGECEAMYEEREEAKECCRE